MKQINKINILFVFIALLAITGFSPNNQSTVPDDKDIVFVKETINQWPDLSNAIKSNRIPKIVKLSHSNKDVERLVMSMPDKDDLAKMMKDIFYYNKIQKKWVLLKYINSKDTPTILAIAESIDELGYIEFLQDLQNLDTSFLLADKELGIERSDDSIESMEAVEITYSDNDILIMKLDERIASLIEQKEKRSAPK